MMGRKQRVIYQTAILPAAGVLPQSGMQIPDEPGGVPETGGDRGGNGPLAATRYRTVRTVDYVGNLVFEDGDLKHIHTPTGFIEDGEYYHQLTDYQGNACVVIDNGGTIYERNNYYPYVMPIADEHYSTAVTPYKFGGKEFDTMNGLNAYDFSARILDPVLCQFTSADPLAERYFSHSPYLYCAGNPVLFIDPTGEAKRHFYDRLGNYLHSEEYSGEEDAICIVEYKNGVLVLCRDENGKYMELFVGSGLFDILKHGRGYDVYRVLGDVNARNVFEFFANYVSKPYDIEYSLLITGRRPESSVNYITTSHLERMECGVVSIYNQITNNIMISYIREFTHTHPNYSFSSESDRFFAGRIAVVQTSRYQHIPAFNIYYVPAGSYIPYMFSTK